MGLLDGLLGSLAGAMGGPQHSPAANPLLQIMLQMLANNRGGMGGGMGGMAGPGGGALGEILGRLGGQAGMPGGPAAGPGGALGEVLGRLGGQMGGPGAGGHGPSPMGGLGELMEAFRRNGMGDKMDSWIGTGQNAPISAEEIERALGIDQVGSIAQHAGVQPREAASGMAAVLPELIDRLTPHGQAPQGGLGDIASIIEALGRQAR